ncbi:secondary thiamine-phosphate synthase enzyme YjbQ [Methanobrevibacter sp. UBA412]|jgi:secondary thiamine-phosphate synthase enzyme|uniref:secondary thiamine-phosphate synthase enzyme YjbQ n=1 Tax=Methanobrevibacter sp. UBA412 TaxID=1915486 RepID=UPI0039B85090
MTIMEIIKINTKKQFEIIDITKPVNEYLKKLKTSDGLINIYTKHTTSAIIVNENEKGLLKDFKNTLNNLIPENKDYNHNSIDNNARSHLQSLFLSSSQTIPFKDNKLLLGTWQSIFFIELDGPRINREIILTIIN